MTPVLENKRDVGFVLEVETAKLANRLDVGF